LSLKIELKRHQLLIGYFNPIETGTLKPEAFQYIGKLLMFNVAWKIENNDIGAYAGQWALLPIKVISIEERMNWKTEKFTTTINMGWIPEEDINIIEVLGD